MEETKAPEQSSETVPNQTPPAGQSPLGGASPTPEQPKKNWVKIFLVGILGIAILSSTIFAAYQFKPGRAPSPTPTPSPAIISVKEGNPTANWKTYTTNEFLDIDNTMLKKFPNFKTRRMTFKYPHWLEINKVDLTEARADYVNTIVNLGFDLKNREYQTSHGGPNDYSVGLLFTFATVPEGTKAFDKAFWGESIDSQISRMEEKTVNGLKATFAYDPWFPTPTGVIFHLSKTEQVYVLVSFFTFDGDCESERCKTIVKEIEQILSTFKFTN